MSQFSSRPPFNDDPMPWSVGDPRDGRALRSEQEVVSVPVEWCEHDPRAEFDRPQHNPTNPILARFRKWVEGETLSDPCWATEWVEAMNDPFAESDAARVLDVLYETPCKRSEREAQEQHARLVISRLAALGDAS